MKFSIYLNRRVFVMGQTHFLAIELYGKYLKTKHVNRNDKWFLIKYGQSQINFFI